MDHGGRISIISRLPRPLPCLHFTAFTRLTKQKYNLGNTRCTQIQTRQHLLYNILPLLLTPEQWICASGSGLADEV